ncbi:DEAD/DEAH box helicase [Denitrobaculum tricleocarpae]|uniref:DEAD-box ATP-dependent RNA helicase RhpA n=1 Tax=Denitrobaculum tricleocarpae TaxID=2591009 RepID=A0A545TF93_9PROT|nr:DEAD/DEAH box helicase [Denitrobaculum tricleocarpae]TQV75851.1 DEAD/DEAH box helicase [Denitrobaculum tricleocarpae]
MTTSTFAELGIVEPLQRALHAENYLNPTPIQQQAIPLLLKGRDLLGIAQTGTGKTAAFALPLLQRLSESDQRAPARGTRALILAPTRELAIQIGEGIETYGTHLKLRHSVIFGGVGQNPQVRALSKGLDILVATPGRLLDLLSQKHLRLDAVEILILDEADRMLDMGFIRDVRKIVAAVPKKRHSLLFSATMPNDVAHLAADLLNDPQRVEITPAATTVERIEQQVYFVDGSRKRGLLATLLADTDFARVIVFTRTKHGANRVAGHLEKAGITARAIHGNKSQSARQKALSEFKEGSVRVLVATDIAARGIDVDNVTHVINFELPNEPESYVHRIGRTARAGTTGIAVSFCDSKERSYLRDIERLTKKRLSVAGTPEGFAQAASPEADRDNRDERRGNGPKRQRNRGRKPGRPQQKQPAGKKQERSKQPVAAQGAQKAAAKQNGQAADPAKPRNRRRRSRRGPVRTAA